MNRPLWGVFLLWLGTLLSIRLVVVCVSTFGLHEVVLVLVPLAFIYTPVFSCWIRQVSQHAYPMFLPAFKDKEAWRRAFTLTAKVIAVVWIPYLIGYHFYQTQLFGFELQWTWPDSLLKLFAYHLFFVAFPEEMFYRGYIQTRLDEFFPKRWKVWGAEFGPALFITCGLFAMGHSLVSFQWWHFAIFFPSILFGWMRARTGGIVACALFHAWANVLVSTLDTLYGIIPPSGF